MVSGSISEGIKHPDINETNTLNKNINKIHVTLFENTSYISRVSAEIQSAASIIGKIQEKAILISKK